MQSKINKEILKQRFKKSLKTYRENAVVQNETAKNLVEDVIKHCGNIFHRVLEIGAGAGVLTEETAKKLIVKQFFVNDIVEESCNYAENHFTGFEFICGDAEKIDLPDNIDLIISNAAFQWFENLPETFEKFAGLLNYGGILAFSTFGVDNYREIAEITGVSLDYKLPAQLKEIYGKYFECMYENTAVVELYFKHPEDVLRHIRNSGTNSLVSKSWTSRDLKDFRQQYLENFHTEKGFRLTYNPYCLILKNTGKNS
jgi:malonyl-CoA O-methyltransferase